MGLRVNWLWRNHLINTLCEIKFEPQNTRVAVEIVKIFHESKDWEGVNSHLVLLSKRRQQLKQVASLSHTVCFCKVSF